MAKMTQTQIVGHFAEKFGMKRADAKSILDELAALAAKEVKKNGEFTVPGMGKLVLVKRKARMGRNPATGAAIKIPAKTVLKFRIAKAMKDTALPKK
ncbi:MAG: HU family DNA-binding protein [Deinococcus sp.]|nr:HU family DNA-binding protein [Deinococcus sp.]